MCKVGDILLIFNARNKRAVGMHPFIVLDDRNGKVSGVQIKQILDKATKIELEEETA